MLMFLMVFCWFSRVEFSRVFLCFADVCSACLMLWLEESLVGTGQEGSRGCGMKVLHCCFCFLPKHSFFSSNRVRCSLSF